MWVKRFIFFHNVRHPAEMAEVEIKQTCGVNYRFMSTLFSIEAEAGRKLETVLRSRKKKQKAQQSAAQRQG